MTRDRAIASLCVALDVPDASQALSLVIRLKGLVGYFKVGMELFTSEGPDIVRKIVDADGHVFLDLKYHDIPNTVQSASRSAARLGVSLMNVHALGGPEMLRAAVQGATDGTPSNSVDRPKLLAVTVLTSLDEKTFNQVAGGADSVLKHVERLAWLAQESGLDGVVASAREVASVRHMCGESFLVVTPGIRPAGSLSGDQKRVLSPAEAINAGADIIVVGRPIIASPDPVLATESLLTSIMGV